MFGIRRLLGINLFFTIILLLIRGKDWLVAGDPVEDKFTSDILRSDDVYNLIHAILSTKFSYCDIISVQDQFSQYYSKHMSWIYKVQRPIYTMSLDDSGEIAGGFPPLTVKSNGQFCLVFVITCERMETCIFRNETELIWNLKRLGIIRMYRRAIVYIESEAVKELRPPIRHFGKGDLAYNFSSDEYVRDGVGMLNKLSINFQALRVHLTLLRRLENATDGDKWILKEKGISEDDSIFQVLTWSLNWLPGGSPLLFDAWSPTQGFWKGGNVIMQMKHVRRGGFVRIALSRRKLLPFIQVEPGEKAIGLDAEIVKIMEDKYGIKPIFFEALRENNIRNGTPRDWTGPMGKVIRKLAEVGLGSIIYSNQLFREDVKLSPPILLLQGTIACELPKILPRWHAILLTFKPITWALTFPSLIVILFLFKRFTIIHNEETSSNNPFAPVASSNWLIIFGPLLQRPVDVSRLETSNSTRTLFSMWLVASFVLSVSYSTILISKFSVPSRELPIETVRDLVESDKPWEIVDTVKFYFANSTDFYEREAVLGSKGLNNATNLIGVLADNQAYGFFLNHTNGCLVVERKRAKYVIRYFSEMIGNGYRKPTIRLSTETVYLGPAGWAIRGDVDFLFYTSFIIYFNRYREIGILNKVERMYAPRPKYFPSEHLEDSALTMEVLGVVFIILFMGYAWSFSAFFMELAIYNYFRFRQINNQSRLLALRD